MSGRNIHALLGKQIIVGFRPRSVNSKILGHHSYFAT